VSLLCLSFLGIFLGRLNFSPTGSGGNLSFVGALLSKRFLLEATLLMSFIVLSRGGSSLFGDTRSSVVSIRMSGAVVEFAVLGVRAFLATFEASAIFDTLFGAGVLPAEDPVFEYCLREYVRVVRSVRTAGVMGLLIVAGVSISSFLFLFRASIPAGSAGACEGRGCGEAAANSNTPAELSGAKSNEFCNPVV
jgi:hypothetical protein